MQARGPMGTTWQQHVSYLDDNQWKGPITVPNSDNLLDVRPPMTAIGPGDLLMIAVTDHRLATTGGGGGGGRKKKWNEKQMPAQQKTKAKAVGNREQQLMLNTDLYAAEFHFGSPAAAQASSAPAEKVVADPDAAPERAQISTMRIYHVNLGSANLRIMRGEFHLHTEISGDGGDGGPLIDAYRYLIDAADMDWAGCCDPDNSAVGREYSWWIIQKLTDAYHLGSRYVPMFSYERSVVYPEGHRNTVMARRGVRPLARLPLSAEDAHDTGAPDTQMLYRYLKQFDAIVASHTSGTNMGMDWRDNDPQVEPVVEIYQGDRQSYEMPGAPHTNNAEDSQGGWRPLGFVSLALQKGYRLGFQSSSDHVDAHVVLQSVGDVADPRRHHGGVPQAAGIWVDRQHPVDVRCGGHFMGEEFSVSQPPAISVKLWGMANFAKVHVIKDGQYA